VRTQLIRTQLAHPAPRIPDASPSTVIMTPCGRTRASAGPAVTLIHQQNIQSCCLLYLKAEQDQGITSRELELPRYFFIIQFSESELDDPHGTLLASDDSAHSYAERVIRELKADADYDGSSANMIVKDAEGRTVCSIPF
jgi:hypothetical protein